MEVKIIGWGRVAPVNGKKHLFYIKDTKNVLGIDSQRATTFCDNYGFDSWTSGCFKEEAIPDEMCKNCVRMHKEYQKALAAIK